MFLPKFDSPDPRIDADALKALARQATTSSRSELAQSVVVLFDSPSAELNPEARSMAYDILHTLIRDIEMATRQEISRRLAEQGDAPKELIRFLANDAIEVAFPVLLKSGVLDDEDLIEVIRMRSIEHALAVADRPALSPAVANALAMTGAEDVIVAVLKNPGAAFAPGTMDYLVEKSREQKAIQGPILKRPEINSGLALRMFAWVSAVLREYILSTFEIDKAAFNQLCETIVLDEIERYANKPSGAGSFSKKLPGLIKEKGKLTPDMLILALREGDVDAFVNMFGRMTDLKAQIIDRLLFDPTGRGLAVFCKSSDAGKFVFASLFTLGQKIKSEATGTIKQRLLAATEFYDALSKKDADDVMNEWRKGVDYVGSIRALGQQMRELRH